jgi:hypothetical protein
MSRASIDRTAITGYLGKASRRSVRGTAIFSEMGDADFSSGKAQCAVPCLHVPLNDPDGFDRAGLFEPAGKAKSLESNKVGLDLL